MEGWVAQSQVQGGTFVCYRKGQVPPRLIRILVSVGVMKLYLFTQPLTLFPYIDYLKDLNAAMNIC
jgi:hypothetical protein